MRRWALALALMACAAGRVALGGPPLCAVGHSLAEGMELSACKDLVRQLTVGQNIEPAMAILARRAAAEGPAGAEAKALLSRCEAWIEQVDGEIRATLADRPSKAIVLGALFARTAPTRSAEFREALALAGKQVETSRLAASRKTLEKLRAAPAKTPAERKALLAKAQMQLRQLGQPASGQPTTDFQDVKAQWEAFADGLTEAKGHSDDQHPDEDQQGRAEAGAR